MKLYIKKENSLQTFRKGYKLNNVKELSTMVFTNLSLSINHLSTTTLFFYGTSHNVLRLCVAL